MVKFKYMTQDKPTPEEIVAMSYIIDKHYPNSDYVSYSDIRAMMFEYAASLNRQGWTRVESVQQDFKELNVYFNDLYHHGVNQVKDSGHLWIEFSDKFRTFEKTILSMSNQTEAERIKELEDGIKWALDNPQSVFVFNELQKLLK
jgi:hypothetical protein